MKRLAVAVSGTGSLLEAMLQQNVPVSFVFADRKCRGLEIARAAGVDAELIERTDFSRSTFDRRPYTLQTIAALKRRDIGLVAMAGYMTIFSPEIFDEFGGRILNTHPSLLPAFKGDHAVRDAIAAGVKVIGCTIHIATPELDEGPILGRDFVKVYPKRPGESFVDRIKNHHELIKIKERVLYPRIIMEQLALLG